MKDLKRENMFDMAFNKAVVYADGVRALGRAINCDASALCKYQRERKMPMQRAKQIEFYTQGKARAYQFCPDIWPPHLFKHLPWETLHPIPCERLSRILEYLESLEHIPYDNLPKTLNT